MLVLSRNEEERIFIGDDIVVTIVQIHKDRVRVGITAPQGVSIYREEIAPINHPQLPPKEKR